MDPDERSRANNRPILFGIFAFFLLTSLPIQRHFLIGSNSAMALATFFRLTKVANVRGYHDRAKWLGEFSVQFILEVVLCGVVPRYFGSSSGSSRSDLEKSMLRGFLGLMGVWTLYSVQRVSDLGLLAAVEKEKTSRQEGVQIVGMFDNGDDDDDEEKDNEEADEEYADEGEEEWVIGIKANKKLWMDRKRAARKRRERALRAIRSSK